MLSGSACTNTSRSNSGAKKCKKSRVNEKTTIIASSSIHSVTIQVRNTVQWSCCYGEGRTLELSIGGGREQGVGPNLDVTYKCTHVIC